MKKINRYLITLFVSLLLFSLVNAGLSGNTYSDEKYGFEITLPAEWKINTSGVKKHVLILSPDEASEVGVDVFPLNAKQREAIDVATNQFNAYDSWEYIAGRHLGFFEKHGADSGFCVMYNKSVFGSSGRQKKIIVQEYYLLKNGRAYIVTLLTDSEHWENSKTGMLDALNSFRIY